jgi:hypothetical protein
MTKISLEKIQRNVFYNEVRKITKHEFQTVQTNQTPDLVGLAFKILNLHSHQ